MGGKKNPPTFPEIVSGFEHSNQQMRKYCVSSCLLFWAVGQQRAQDSATQRKVCRMVLYQPAAPWWRHCSATREIPERPVASTTPSIFKFLGKHPKLCGTVRLRSNSSSSFFCEVSRRAESPLSSFKIFQLTLTSGAGSGTEADRGNFQFRFGNLNSQREAGATSLHLVLLNTQIYVVLCSNLSNSGTALLPLQQKKPRHLKPGFIPLKTTKHLHLLLGLGLCQPHMDWELI